jgi:HPt (histidine-containing phosphotransfer) domain-containing protein
VAGDLLKELYMEFIGELSKLSLELKNNLRDNNFDAMAKDLHTIMGLVSNYRANHVYEIAKTMKLRLRDKNIKLITYYFLSLNEVIDESIVEIQNYFLCNPKCNNE